jgi:hypothetical protein
MNGVSLLPLKLGSEPANKPISPRLLPLGSPGPVTPMDLADSGTGGYLDKALGSTLAEANSRQSEAASAKAT